jgi:signal transduction histidine kinase
MTKPPESTGTLLGTTVEEITDTTWLLGHDLKSPIAIVISALEILISVHEEDETMAHSVNLLRGALIAANRQYNMISDLLDLARLETNDYELQRYDTDMAAFIRDCLEHENSAIKAKHLRLEVDIPSDASMMVSIDGELFRRVVAALVDNTIKFTVRDDTLRVSVHRVGATIEILFSDTGRGIFPDFEAHLTERGPQWDNRQAGSRTSVGMGLPFVHAVLKAHGGSFTGKTDAQTKFTTFTLQIPALNAPAG